MASKEITGTVPSSRNSIVGMARETCGTGLLKILMLLQGFGM
jgi:hypothetical protein